MKEQSLRRQALVTAGCNAAVRGLGFGMRLWVSRMLGAEAVGVMELASSAHMLALTPAAAGLPGAVSRLTARARPGDELLPLYAGRQLALAMTLLLTPLLLLLAPRIAAWLGDGRTLPSLYLFAPCMGLIGVSSVYDGYCFGRGNAWPPALSELAEQLVRLLVSGMLLLGLPRLTIAYRAAVPALATTLGEALGLAVMVGAVGQLNGLRGDPRLPGLRRQLLRLGMPLMLTRLSHTGLRALCGAIIPLRLMAAGLSKSEAVSRLGMLNGMALPLMLLPGMLAGALGTVGGPAAARCASLRAENRLALRLLLPALGAGTACGGALYALAPVLACRLYRLPELAGLIRVLCPMAMVLPLQQVLGGLMTGLGLQRKALVASLLGAAVTLMATWRWAARPALQIYGAGYASLAGHGLTLLCTLISFLLREKQGAKATCHF